MTGRLLGLGLGAFLSISAQADPPRFVALKSDRPNYRVGERAVLTAYIRIQPDNPKYEIFLSSRLGDAALKVTRISDNHGASISPRFANTGTFEWTVDVFLQDKRQAHSFLAAIQFYEKENCRLEERLSGETDPEKRAQIQAEMARNREIIAAAQKQLLDLRRQVDSLTLSVSVTEGSRLELWDDSVASENSALRITADHEDPREYRVGERATLTVRVTRNFSGEDGPRENIVRATFDGVAIGVVKVSRKEFLSTTRIFSSQDVGRHTYRASLSIRSKAQADSLRDAIEKAEERRGRHVEERDQTEDEMERAYFEQEIAELTAIIGEFFRQLEEALLFVTSKDLLLAVVSPGKVF